MTRHWLTNVSPHNLEETRARLEREHRRSAIEEGEPMHRRYPDGHESLPVEELKARGIIGLYLAPKVPAETGHKATQDDQETASGSGAALTEAPQ